MATLEQTIEAEQQAYDAAEEQGEAHDDANAGTPVDENGQPTLIDRSQYEREDLAISKVDGNQIDRIRLKVSGTVTLDRSSVPDVKLWNDLVLGRDITLMVEGRCAGTGAKEATGRDGDLDVVVGEKTVRVHTLYVSVAEGLRDKRTATEADTAAEVEAVA